MTERSRQSTRRSFLLGISAMAVARGAIAQSNKPQIAAKTLNNLIFNVVDVDRSVKFYQALFGMRNYAHQGALPLLEIGSGPSFMGLRRRMPGDTNLSRVGLGVDGFNVDQIMRTLAAHGVVRSKTPGEKPMTAWVSTRGDTPEVFFNDPCGVPIQLQDVNYCGGSGALGDRCPPRPRELTIQPSKAPVRVHTINHLLIDVSDPARSTGFWRQLFGMTGGDTTRRTHLIVGPGPQWLLFRGTETNAKPSMDHWCLGVENWDPDGILKRLVGFGLKERVTSSTVDLGAKAAAPLMAWSRDARRDSENVTTIEVFLSDPDNNIVQVNDVQYCRGFGWLGSVCP